MERPGSKPDRISAPGAWLVEFLQSHPDDPATQGKIEALSAFGPKASAGVPGIRERPRRKEARVQKAATEALAKIQTAK